MMLLGVETIRLEGVTKFWVEIWRYNEDRGGRM